VNLFAGSGDIISDMLNSGSTPTDIWVETLREGNFTEELILDSRIYISGSASPTISPTSLPAAAAGGGNGSLVVGVGGACGALLFLVVIVVGYREYAKRQRQTRKEKGSFNVMDGAMMPYQDDSTKDRLEHRYRRRVWVHLSGPWPFQGHHAYTFHLSIYCGPFLIS
jgi:hypothetical protein